eukprot:9511566-Karenia_brevis.AAC.1
MCDLAVTRLLAAWHYYHHTSIVCGAVKPWKRRLINVQRYISQFDFASICRVLKKEQGVHPSWYGLDMLRLP